MKKIRVAIDCRMIECSGIGVYLRNILKYMLSDISIDYLLLGKESDLSVYENYSNCEIAIVNILPFSLKELVMFPVQKVNRCDCFYTPNYNVPLGIKIPIISTIHDVVFLDIPHLTSPIGRFMRYVYLKQAIIRSQSLFTVSRFSKDRILHYFPNIRHLKITYNGVADTIMPISEKASPQYPFPYFLYVGNIKPHKGLKCLLEAYSHLKENGEKRKLVIVGKSENFKTADQYIQRLLKAGTLNNDVIFTGRIDDKKLVNIISFASLLIQPSIYEGFGIPPLESVYLGTPVLISDIPVFREIYKGFPVEFFLCNNVYDLYHKMQNHDCQRVKLSCAQKNKYTYKKTASIVMNDIKQIVQ